MTCILSFHPNATPSELSDGNAACIPSDRELQLPRGKIQDFQQAETQTHSYREAKRCGRPIFHHSEHRTTKQRFFEFMVSFAVPFYENYRDAFNADFDCYDEAYRIA